MKPERAEVWADIVRTTAAKRLRKEINKLIKTRCRSGWKTGECRVYNRDDFWTDETIVDTVVSQLKKERYKIEIHGNNLAISWGTD